jgi:hypothetical protein
VIRGGLRSRLVLDSVRFAVLSTLQQLGWFDPTVHDTPPGIRQHRPFRYIPRPVEWTEAIEPNAIAISSDTISDDDLAFGGEVEDALDLYVDLFVEDDQVGWHTCYDIRDSILGKSPELGNLGPQIDVYDFRQPTPAPFTVVDLEEIRVDRSQGDAREWQRHWFMVRITVLDDYNDEAFQPAPQTTWTPQDRTNWDRIQEVEQHVP